jgi:hypothetical protein
MGVGKGGSLPTATAAEWRAGACRRAGGRGRVRGVLDARLGCGLRWCVWVGGWDCGSRWRWRCWRMQSVGWGWRGWGWGDLAGADAARHGARRVLPTRTTHAPHTHTPHKHHSHHHKHSTHTHAHAPRTSSTHDTQCHAARGTVRMSGPREPDHKHPRSRRKHPHGPPPNTHTARPPTPTRPARQHPHGRPPNTHTAGPPTPTRPRGSAQSSCAPQVLRGVRTACRTG